MWLPAPAPEAFSISLSRWGHDLRIRQPNGDEYSVTAGSSQGDLILLNGGSAWYQSYYYFDAGGYRRAGLEYWVYDATTGEEAPWGQTGLIDWVYLPSPYQALATVSGRPQAIEVSWRLPMHGDEALLGGGFQIERWTASTGWEIVATLGATDARKAQTPDEFHYTDNSLPVTGVSYKYRVRYAYGSQVGLGTETLHAFVDLDSDQDGLSDEWEIATFGNLANNAIGDFDGDGISNSNEAILGTNPTSSDSDSDGLGDSQEVELGTDPVDADTDNDLILDGADRDPLTPNPPAPAPLEAIVLDIEAEVVDPDRTQFELRWQTNSEWVSGFIVARRISGGVWEEVERMGSAERTLPVTNLLAGQRYYYRVTAFHQPPGTSIEALSEPAFVSYEVPLLRSLLSRGSLGSAAHHYAPFLSQSGISYSTAELIISRPALSSGGQGSFTMEFTAVWAGENLTVDWTQTQGYDYSGTLDGIHTENHSESTATFHFETTSTLSTFRTDATYDLEGESTGGESFDPALVTGRSWTSIGTDEDHNSFHSQSLLLIPPDPERHNAIGLPYGYSPFEFRRTGTAVRENGFTLTKTYDDGEIDEASDTNRYASTFREEYVRWGPEGEEVLLDPEGHPLNLRFSPQWDPLPLTNFRHFIPGNAARLERTAVREVWRLLEQGDETTYTLTFTGPRTISEVASEAFESFLPYAAEMLSFSLPEHITTPLDTGAYGYLDIDGARFFARKVQYRLKTNPSLPREVAWWEVFTAESDDPATTDADESLHPRLALAHTWQAGSQETETPIYEINPAERSDGRGSYALVLAPKLVGLDPDGQPLDDADWEVTGFPLFPVSSDPPSSEALVELQPSGMAGARYAVTWEDSALQVTLEIIRPEDDGDGGGGDSSSSSSSSSASSSPLGGAGGPPTVVVTRTLQSGETISAADFEEAISIRLRVVADPAALAAPTANLQLAMQDAYGNAAGGDSLKVGPLPVDIIVRKKGEPVDPKGVLVKKGDVLEIALAESWFAQEKQFENLITWKYRQMELNGTFPDTWTDFGNHGKGTKFEHTTALSGIFELKAAIGSTGSTQDQFYQRKKDDSHSEHKKRENDCFGVADESWQLKVRQNALFWLGKSDYARGVRRHPIPAGPPRGWKCNLFVADCANTDAFRVMWINGNVFIQSYPPVANQWAGTENKNIPNWSLLGADAKPQPGYVVARGVVGDSGHTGILDYDGCWISAMRDEVNRKSDLRNSTYQPARVRKYTGN